MRIISKFKDYYDGCQGYGRDPKLVYVRERKEIELNWNEHHEIKEQEMLQALKPLSEIWSAMPSFGKYYEHNSGCIAFCGKVYPFYLWNDEAYFQISKLVSAIEADRGKPWASQHYISELLASLKEEPRKARWRWRHRYGNLNLGNWSDFYEETNLTVPDSLHRFFKSPVVVRLDRKIVVNPNLKDYNFASQVDPYTAYQELSMYVGNNLATQMDPEVHISDKLRAESKGFDEWSFRRPPKGKK